jgi:hypothetical protein
MQLAAMHAMPGASGATPWGTTPRLQGALKALCTLCRRKEEKKETQKTRVQSPQLPDWTAYSNTAKERGKKLGSVFEDPLNFRVSRTSEHMNKTRLMTLQRRTNMTHGWSRVLRTRRQETPCLAMVMSFMAVNSRESKPTWHSAKE